MLTTAFEIALVTAWLARQAMRLLFWLVKALWTPSDKE